MYAAEDITQGSNQLGKVVSSNNDLSCDKCSRRFKWPCRLKEHMMGAECEVCDKWFSRKADKDRHKEQVHGQVLYACPRGDYDSKRKDNTAKHMRKKHGWKKKSKLKPTGVVGQVNSETRPIRFETAEAHSQWLQSTRSFGSPLQKVAATEGTISYKDCRQANPGASMDGTVTNEADAVTEQNQLQQRTMISYQDSTVSAETMLPNGHFHFTGNIASSNPVQLPDRPSLPGHGTEAAALAGHTNLLERFEFEYRHAGGDPGGFEPDCFRELHENLFDQTRSTALSSLPPHELLHLGAGNQYLPCMQDHTTAYHQNQTHSGLGPSHSTSASRPQVDANSTYQGSMYLGPDCGFADAEDCDDLTSMAGACPTRDELVSHTTFDASELNDHVTALFPTHTPTYNPMAGQSTLPNTAHAPFFYRFF